MPRRVSVFIFGLVFLMADVCSQQLSHQVMVPAAGIVISGGTHYTHTIGEPAILILASEEKLLTEGFQQPRVKMQIGTKPDGNGVNAYPNPVKDIIWIELFGDFSRTFNITIINIYGLEVFREELSFTGKFWYKDYRSVADLKPGFYLIRFISKDGTINRTIKVEKM